MAWDGWNLPSNLLSAAAIVLSIISLCFVCLRHVLDVRNQKDATADRVAAAYISRNMKVRLTWCNQPNCMSWTTVTEPLPLVPHSLTSVLAWLQRHVNKVASYTSTVASDPRAGGRAGHSGLWGVLTIGGRLANVRPAQNAELEQRFREVLAPS